MGIREYLADERVVFEDLPHAPAFCAQKLAKYLGVPGGRVAKAVLLRGPAGLFIAVLPATHQIDLGRLAEVQGGPVRLADTEEVAATFTDCEWGVVSPFGSLYGLPTFLDESIGPDDWIVAEAGTHVDAVRLSAGDFARLSGSRRGAFARPA
jgi:Ala-tRNA(Pro) deacylase